MAQLGGATSGRPREGGTTRGAKWRPQCSRSVPASHPADLMEVFAVSIAVNCAGRNARTRVDRLKLLLHGRGWARQTVRWHSALIHARLRRVRSHDVVED